MKAMSALVALLSLAALPVTTPADSAEDGKYAIVFYSARSGNRDVYILHPGEKEPRNLTQYPAADLCPAASPDGKHIAFLSDRDGNFEVYQVNRDGSTPLRLTHDPAWDGWAAFVPASAPAERP